MKSSRGATLLTTMVFLAVIAAMGLALAGLSVQHLSAASAQENRQQSLLLARSVVSLGLSRLMQDTNFGKATSAKPTELLQVSLPDNRAGAAGQLTFDAELARRNRIAYSTNNLEVNTSSPGAGGRVVPKNSVLLIGEGRCGGVVRRVEAILAVPPFPYAVASAGPVDARLGVTIAGLPNSSHPDTGGAPWLPADMLSNDSGAQAIFLGSGTSITGNVKAAGKVTLDPNALNAIKIDGRVTSGAAREKIPHIPIGKYDPQLGSKPFTTLTTDPPGPAIMAGVFRRRGNLNCAHGLRMDGGVLYVDGDLTVTGGIAGKGLIACTGKLTVQGQSDFRSGNGLAVLAGKDLKISGSDSSGSFFQGLMYTKGSFEADRVTVVGTLVADDETSSRPVLLKNARVFHAPDGVPQVEPNFVPQEPTGPPVGQAEILMHYENTGHGYKAIITMGPGEPVQVALGTTASQARAAYLDVFRPLTAGNPDRMATLENWLRKQGLDDPGPGPSGGPGSILTLDPSSFLNLVDRTRVVLWKEL